MKNVIYTIDEIRERIVPIAQKYGLKRVILFGSYARNDATKDSDIDLIIKLNHSIGLFTFNEMVEAFENALEKNVDCITEDSVSLEFRFEILDDEVLLYAA